MRASRDKGKKGTPAGDGDSYNFHEAGFNSGHGVSITFDRAKRRGGCILGCNFNILHPIRALS